MTKWTWVFGIYVSLLTLLGTAVAQGPEAARGPAEIIMAAPDSHWRTLDPEYTLYIDLKPNGADGGRIVVELSRDLAPAHVAQVKTLARAGYYDGLDFYRVVDGFVAQGGDINAASEPDAKPLPPLAAPTLDGEFETALQPGLPFFAIPGPDGYAARTGFLNGFPAGVSVQQGRIWLAHCYGAFAFGRDTGANTASTEFYITLGVWRYLDRNLTVFGAVRAGMEFVQALPRGDEGPGVISDPALRVPFEFKIAADVPAPDRTDLQVMDTNSRSFAQFVDARRNRPEDFFLYKQDYADVCSIRVPVRPAP